MECFLALMLPIVLLLMSFILAKKWFPALQPMGRYAWRLLRWLWRGKAERRGAGRITHPELRYRPPQRGGR